MTTDLTQSDVENILKMIDAAEHLEEIEIVHGGFRLHVVRGGGSALRGVSRPSANVAQNTHHQAASAKPAAAALATAAPQVVPEGVVAIRAPMLGVFYRAPAPGERPFVEVGQRVHADDTVCLIEVMKLFNTIRAGVDGEIVNILVDNGGLVEFDQPIIFLEPSKG